MRFLRSMARVHIKCRNAIYPGSKVQRFPVDATLVSWLIKFEDYIPRYYESPTLANKPWADQKLGADGFLPQWNAGDQLINRRSHMGDYCIVEGAPRNPCGRTGIVGRGILGRWGPNHAADPIVTRWKRESNSLVIHQLTKLPIMQFCAIQRHDNNEWAIPGGMVDPGEQVSKTLMREFLEEAMNSLEKNRKQVGEDQRMLATFFANGTEIYRGYVDDPRNTDNAWIETIAVNFHDETSEFVGKFNLVAGDDAKGVRWMDIDHESALYASHLELIEKVAALHKAHF